MQGKPEINRVLQLERGKRTRGRYTRKYEVRYVMPAEAVRLTEDIHDLKSCLRILDYIDPVNVADSVQDGHKLLRMARANVNAARRYAEQRMRELLLNAGDGKRSD